MPRLTANDLKKRASDYKKAREKNGDIGAIPTAEEQEEFFENLDKVDKKTGSIVMTRIMNEGNYAEFQNLDYYTRAMLTVPIIQRIKSTAKEDYSVKNEQLVKLLHDNVGRPDFREAISLMKQNGDKNFKMLDDYMNQVSFQQTLNPPTKEQRENVLKINPDVKPLFKRIKSIQEEKAGILTLESYFKDIQEGTYSEQKLLDRISKGEDKTTLNLYNQMKAGTYSRDEVYARYDAEIASIKEQIETFRHEEEPEYKKAIESQKVMAKTMLMAHLSKYTVKDKKGNEIDYKDSLADTFAHGGRTNFILPHGINQTAVEESIFGKNPEQTSGFQKRTAATHYASRRKVENNTVTKESKEEKVSKANAVRIFSDAHYGMNIAAGGYGTIGPNKKPTLVDGTAGHMYCRKSMGDPEHCGSLLIGFESCESGKTSVLGHEHTWMAKSSKQSAFLADKFGVGAKHDGRTVDLSGLSPEQFAKFMNEFDKVYSDLQLKAENDEKAREKITNFNKFLAGSRLEADALKEVLTDLGMDGHIVNKSVTCARTGLEARKSSSEKVIPIPDKKEVDKYLNDFNKAVNKLGIDLSDKDSLNRLKVMEKVDGKWSIQPVITDDMTNEQKYAKINALFISNDAVIMAYGIGKVEPNEVKFGKNGPEISKYTIQEDKEPDFPKKVPASHRFFNAITFGRAYQSEIRKYNNDLAIIDAVREKNRVFSADVSDRIAEAVKESSNITRIRMSDDKQFLKDLDLDKDKEITSMNIDKDKEKSLDKDTSKNS